MIRKLSKSQLNEVARYDLTNYQALIVDGSHLTNRGRNYKFLVTRGADVEIHTVAVKVRKTDGRTVAKEIVRASVDSPSMWVKDVVFKMIAGYVVDWSPEKCGYAHQWSYGGKWGKEDYTPKSMAWKIRGKTVNPEVLKEHPRFKYCAFSDDGVNDILDYLKSYVQHPRIEMLSKAGLGGLALRTGFVKLMETDKAFCSFIANNHVEIRAKRVGVAVVISAYRKGITIAEARTEAEYRRIMQRGGGLKGSGINPQKAVAYIGNQIETSEYSAYIGRCMKLGLDLSDTKNAFPKNFKQRNKELVDILRKMEIDENKELYAQRDAKLAKVFKKLSGVEFNGRTLAVRLPRCAEDFEIEGDTLSHCVNTGCYEEQMVSGESIIMFVRKREATDIPFVTVEYDTKSHSVSQCYGENNSTPPPEVCKWVYGALQKRVSSFIGHAGVRKVAV